MYKNFTKILCSPGGYMLKLLHVISSQFYGLSKADQRKIIMRINLTSVLLIIGFLQVSAASLAQKITLSKKNVSIRAVLDDISKQSGYDFFYDANLLNTTKRISVNLHNADLTDALNICLAEQNLTYSINSNTVVIKQKEKTFIDRIIDAFKAMDVTGRITDESGRPLNNASIKVKGTSMATTANENGSFTLKNVAENAVLIVSFVGYQTLEIAANKNLSNIRLSIETSKLEEVAIVSTGYRNIKNASLTGAASVVTQKTYDQRVAVTGNFLESLEGKVPGLMYNSATGDFMIRGVSTFDAVKQPLIVLDGFPTEVDIRAINPNDIVSVSVLKDAAAASIYGARASNGVIVIETKRGKSGKTAISLRATYAFQDKLDFTDLNYGNATEYAQLQKDYILNAKQVRSTYTNAKAPISPVQSAVFDYNEGPKTSATLDALNNRINEIGSYDNLNEYKDLFYRKRLARQVDFNVSGGTEKNTYLLGLNYGGEVMNYQRTDNDRILLNFASTHQFTKGLKLDFRGTYSRLNAQDPGARITTNSFLPYEHLADGLGNPMPMSVGNNRNSFTGVIPANNTTNIGLGLYDNLYYPYGELTANTNKSKSSGLRFQARLNGKITDWLNFELGGAFEDQVLNQERLQTENSFLVRRLLNYKAAKDPTTGTALFSDLPTGDFMGRQTINTNDYTLRGQLNFNYSSADLKHVISGIAGTEIRNTSYSAYQSTFFGYDGQTLIMKPVNFGRLTSSLPPAFSTLSTLSRASFIYEDYFSESESDLRFVSVYGEGSYTYNTKYGLTASLRFDQTNLFGTDPKYRNKPFYSVGANWHLNQESFLKDVEWLAQLKLRAAYGVNGNVPNSNNGPFLILNSGLNYYIDPVESYYDVQSPQNQSIRWEQTKNYNLGLDYAFLNNRIFGAIDLYKKNSIDVFGQFSSDPTSGFNEYNANTASILNNGFEFSINSMNIQTPKFGWQTQITASLNKNKVTAVKTVSSSPDGLPVVSILNVQKGYPIDALFAYDYAGLNSLGQPMIIGANGEKKMISTSSLGTEAVVLEDLQYMGTTTPKQAIGFNNQFRLGNFDLSMLFMYYGGYVTRIEAPNPTSVSSTGRVLAGSINYWRATGDEANTQIPGFPVTNTPGYFDEYARTAYTYASSFVRKANHIRLRDIVLTYNLKTPFTKKIGLNNTQVRAQVQNAYRYTFSGNDVDPDAINKRTGQRSLIQQPFYSLSLYTNF